MAPDPRPLLRLLSVPNIGPQRVRQLVSHFGSAEAVLAADVADLAAVDGIDRILGRAVRDKTDPRFAETQADAAVRHGVRLMTFWDDDYPELLKAIHDPPVLLYIKGPFDWGRFSGLAVVGTRFPSSYGRQVAEQLSSDLSANGVTVVSGMARGVDTAAHRGGLKGPGASVAVLGSGIDVVYPPENRALYLELLERGAVVSEFPIGATPEAAHFPRRNRIVSGMCRGTLVVEAGEKSGALLTADLALEQNRDVFAVPGNVTSPKSTGTNRLIRSGAILVTSAADVFSEYPDLAPSRPADPSPAPAETPELTGAEKTLWEAMTAEPVHIDRLAAECRLPASEALAALLSMELKSCVKQWTGMRFARVQ
jgi:DNA processing protein